METTKYDPENRPQQGAALFRWILEKRKAEEASQTQEDKACTAESIRKLKQRNAERGTPIVGL